MESFDPTDLLVSLRARLEHARFAVEGEDGRYRRTGPFPDTPVVLDSTRVEFEDMLGHPATRVIVMSPDQDLEQFAAVVASLDLLRVSYAIGRTGWIDLAAEGVNKATAMERVRLELGIPRERVMAVADGRNDIELLTWASEGGRGVAMGGSHPEVIAVAAEVTGTVHEDGLARVLATL